MVNLWRICPRKLTCSAVIYFKISISIRHITNFVMTAYKISHQMIYAIYLKSFLHLVVEQFK